jgi:hypothetical protein
MVKFKLPSDGGGLRACCLGSCRVHDPLYRLRDRGDLRICDAGFAATHSAAEALQALDLVTGDQTILAETLRTMGLDRHRDYPAEHLFWFHKSAPKGARPAPI